MTTPGTDSAFDYLIIGAGPTGLGAAHRLAELGVRSFCVLESAGHVGGLSASFRDSEGFTWDVGGHVVFSHYEYVDRLLDRLLGEDSLSHMRVSRVRVAGTWVPYPFQNNIRHLPPQAQWRCVQGLLARDPDPGRPAHFAEWVRASFGSGIAELFMEPYNFKVWATPLEQMAWQWIGERVSLVDLSRVLENLILGRDDVGWGPNATFRFPSSGGTGEIFRRLAAPLAEHIRLNEAVVSIDPEARVARTSTGARIGYGKLLSTMPLDLLVRERLESCPDTLREAAGELVHNSVHVVGVGVDDAQDVPHDPTCWMYFPEADCPFYRVTNFHNYAPANVPRPGLQRALMTETSSSAHKPPRTPDEEAGLEAATLRGLANTTLLRDNVTAQPPRSNGGQDRIASVWRMRAEYGYPVPSLGRDAALRTIQPWLAARGISSRGRFGGWKYEVGNMDHSLMQGVEWADSVATDAQNAAETTYTL